MKIKPIFVFLLVCPILLSAQTDSYTSKLDSLFNKVYLYYYTNQDSTSKYLNQTYTLAIENKDWYSAILALSDKNNISFYSNNLMAVSNNLTKMDSLFDSKRKTLKKEADYMLYHNNLLYQKGNYYFLLNNFKKARVHFNEILENTLKTTDSVIDLRNSAYTTTAYNYLAKMLNEEGKLDKALEYYKKNIRHIKKHDPKNQESLLTTYSLIAEILKQRGQNKEANNYLFKTLKQYLANKNSFSIPVLMNIVQNHNAMAQKDSAYYYLNIAKKLIKNTLTNKENLSIFYQVSGETHQANGNYQLALNDLNKALAFEQSRWKNKKHYKIAHIWNKIGLLQSKFNRNSEALTSYNEALAQLSEFNSSMHQRKAIEILKNKALALNMFKSIKDYKSCLATVDTGIKLIDTLKPTFKNQADKLLLIEDAFPLFEAGIQASFELYELQKDKSFIDKAFLYSEKSKSALLLEALLASKATNFANIPNDIIEKEKLIKVEITHIEKELNDNNHQVELQDKLFNLKKDYQNLTVTIEKEFPLYYNLKYNSNVISITEAQKLLSTEELLLSYFYGNKKTYVISFCNNSKNIHAIAIDTDLNHQITEIHNMLGNPTSDVSLLSKKTHQLYQHIVAPALTPQDKKKLLIIPDGLLNYIPFGALNAGGNEISYLTESHSVSYTNSMTLLKQLKNKSITNQNLLAFAPSFDNSTPSVETKKKLLPLPHNKREVAQIMTSFKGSQFLGEHASLKNFTSNIGDFGVIHLATHAIFDDAIPEYSYLAFSEKQNEEHLLYVRDLYNLQLNADLVTLSACETGMGALKKGEGFMGLAHGFFYGGASSIASTLWKINDASSTKLMDSFYKNLMKGNAKDIALQQAKIDFLHNNKQNALSHPYYWSGYIISGNTTPLNTTTSWRYWALGGVVLLITTGLWVFRKKQAA